MNVDNVTDEVMQQMGWTTSYDNYYGIRRTVKAAIYATLSLSNNSDDDDGTKQAGEKIAEAIAK